MAIEVLLYELLTELDDGTLSDLFAYAVLINTDKESIDNLTLELKRRNIHPVH